jgi:hypothetical protein
MAATKKNKKEPSADELKRNLDTQNKALKKIIKKLSKGDNSNKNKN